MPTAKVCFLLPSSIDCSISAFRCIVRSRQRDWGSVIILWQYDGASWSWISRIQCQCTVEQLCSLSIHPQVPCLSTLDPHGPERHAWLWIAFLSPIACLFGLTGDTEFSAVSQTYASKWSRLTMETIGCFGKGHFRVPGQPFELAKEWRENDISIEWSKQNIYAKGYIALFYLQVFLIPWLIYRYRPVSLESLSMQASGLQERRSLQWQRKAPDGNYFSSGRFQALRTSYIASLTEWLCTTSKTPQLLVKPSWASPSAAIAKRKPCQQAVNCWLGDCCYFLIILPLQFDCQVNDSLVLTRYQQYWFSLAANLAVLVLDLYWRAHVSDSTTDEKALGYTTTPLSFSI